MKGPVPPYVQQPGFLAEDEHDRLLAWVLDNRARFTPARVIGGVVDPALRVSETLRDLGPLEEMLSMRLRAALPSLAAATATRAFEADSLELELAAHGEGAHFAPHRDIPIGEGRRRLDGEGSGRHDRVLSAVYYFHREPRAFAGGELRLHRFGSDGAPGDFLDLAPTGNSLVAFPSWITHEVRRVACPTGRFEDYRFALNAWFCRALG